MAATDMAVEFGTIHRYSSLEGNSYACLCSSLNKQQKNKNKKAKTKQQKQKKYIQKLAEQLC